MLTRFIYIVAYIHIFHFLLLNILLKDLYILFVLSLINVLWIISKSWLLRLTLLRKFVSKIQKITGLAEVYEDLKVNLSNNTIFI